VETVVDVVTDVIDGAFFTGFSSVPEGFLFELARGAIPQNTIGSREGWKGRRECIFGVLLMETRVIRWEREFLRHQNFASVDLCDDVRRLKGVAGITSDRNGPGKIQIHPTYS